MGIFKNHSGYIHRPIFISWWKGKKPSQICFKVEAILKSWLSKSGLGIEKL